MFIETVKSEGLAHYSYMVGDGTKAAVIDPRRDCEVYLDIAREKGVAITHIFETHRNEDYVIGSRALARKTGAAILHGHEDENPFAYGETVGQGDVFCFGCAVLRVIETPGHTLNSISLSLADAGYDADKPVAVFTGDALFIGGAGRTDFYPGREEEVSGLLYDSLFGKLLPLGDDVLVYPAHGAGSVCGAGLADRMFSTIGYERRFNPDLQVDGRDEFIRMKTAENHYQPPYFKQMERLNQHGPLQFDTLPVVAPLDADGLAKAMDEGAQAVDLRSPEAFAGGHVPGSHAIPLDMLASFAGWYLDYDADICLIADGPEQVVQATRELCRLGFDRIGGFLKGGISAWETAGHRFGTIPAVHAHELGEMSRVPRPDRVLLDVRSIDEVEEASLPNTTHIYVGEVASRASELPKDARIVTFCASGKRALVAAAALKRCGFENVSVCLGSMAACKAIGCRLAA